MSCSTRVAICLSFPDSGQSGLDSPRSMPISTKKAYQRYSDAFSLAAAQGLVTPKNTFIVKMKCYLMSPLGGGESDVARSGESRPGCWQILNLISSMNFGIFVR